MLTQSIIDFEIQYANFLQALELQGKAPRTIAIYSTEIRKSFKYFNTTLDKISQEDLKKYFSWLVKKQSWSVVKQSRSAMQFLWKHVYNKKWKSIDIIKPPVHKKLPDVLSINELKKVFPSIKKQAYRTYLITVYSMGLRLSEALNLKIGDIDSSRMAVHIRSAKGNKDRFVPLPEKTLYLLRKYWAVHRNQKLIFPNLVGNQETIKNTTRIMNARSVQIAIKKAVNECKIYKEVTVHTLRHSYATHLVEKKVNLSVIQKLLGHSSPRTTVKYTQLTNEIEGNTKNTINDIINEILS